MYTCLLYNDLRENKMENALNIPLHRLLEGKNEKYSRLVAKSVFDDMKRRRQLSSSSVVSSSIVLVLQEPGFSS